MAVCSPVQLTTRTARVGLGDDLNNGSPSDLAEIPGKIRAVVCIVLSAYIVRHRSVHSQFKQETAALISIARRKLIPFCNFVTVSYQKKKKCQ